MNRVNRCCVDFPICSAIESMVLKGTNKILLFKQVTKLSCQSLLDSHFDETKPRYPIICCFGSRFNNGQFKYRGPRSSK